MPIVYEVRTALGSEKDAQTIARKLVSEKLAACAQVIPGMTSFYTWEGELHSNSEVLVLIKTTSETWPLLRDRLAELHPYETPEILAVPVEFASFSYLNWVKENTRGS